MALARLAPAFSLADAAAVGVRKDQVYAMLAAGEIDRVGRGVYLRPGDIDARFALLAAVTVVRDEATMCLTSALVHHELCDAIPFETDIALPRGMRRPSGFDYVGWHSFDRATFHIGRERVQVGKGVSIAIYSAERTVVDCFRLMHQEGSDVAYEALRRWLRQSGHSPAALLQTAASFPKAQPRLRQALEVLL